MRGRVVIGAILVLFGALLLIEELGVADTSAVFGTFWPLILIGLGIWGVTTSGWRNLGALVLLGLGAVFLGQELDVFPDDVWQLLWPVALVVIGLWLVLGLRRDGDVRTGTTMQARTDLTAIMAGRDQRVRSDRWEGGQITAIMGGIELDLQEALPVEKGALLEVTAIMGGVELYVPRDWDVDIRATPIMGGVDDNRSRSDVSWPGPRPHLRVRATVLMGGLDINDAASSGPGSERPG